MYMYIKSFYMHDLLYHNEVQILENQVVLNMYLHQQVNQNILEDVPCSPLWNVYEFATYSGPYSVSKKYVREFGLIGWRRWLGNGRYVLADPDDDSIR